MSFEIYQDPTLSFTDTENPLGVYRKNVDRVEIKSLLHLAQCDELGDPETEGNPSTVWVVNIYQLSEPGGAAIGLATEMHIVPRFDDAWEIARNMLASESEL